MSTILGISPNTLQLARAIPYAIEQPADVDVNELVVRHRLVLSGDTNITSLGPRKARLFSLCNKVLAKFE